MQIVYGMRCRHLALSSAPTPDVMADPDWLDRKVPHLRSCVERVIGASKHQKDKFQIPSHFKIHVNLICFYLKLLMVLNQQCVVYVNSKKNKRKLKTNLVLQSFWLI